MGGEFCTRRLGGGGILTLFGGEGAGGSCETRKSRIPELLGIRTEILPGVFRAKEIGGEGTVDRRLLISGEPHIFTRARNDLDFGDINRPETGLIKGLAKNLSQL